MNKRRIERVAAIVLSSALLLSSSGILSSFAANANETSSASSELTTTTASVTQEGGKLSENTVSAEGGSLVITNEGDGTKANPYVITTAEEFVLMQDKINLTTNADKYFKLDADIDLSSIKEADLTKNSGSLISVNKSLSASTNNVFFVLDGNGHTVKGFDVGVQNCKSASLFGYLNSKSVIKNLTVEGASVTVKADSVDTVAILVAENDGTVENVTVKAPKFSFKNASNAGVVAAINNGTISNVTVESNIENTDTVTMSNSTVNGAGSVGAVAGLNKGKITGVSAINVGMYISTDSKLTAIYGGIVGTNSGSVSNSVSTGAVAGGKASDVAGGVIGKALAGTVANNDYTLVKFDNKINACAVIGIGGTADMLNDCYWSSSISNCSAMATDFGAGVNDIDGILFKVVGVGDTITYNPNITWGKASFKLDGNYKLSGSGISATAKDNNVVVTGVKDGTLNAVNYSVKIVLPSTVGMGADSVILSQQISLPIVVGEGNGTASSPFVVEDATDFNLLGSMTGVYAKLSKDVTVKGADFEFVGTLDGAGHKLTTDSAVFSKTIGTVKNVNVAFGGELSSALFGKAVNVNAENINISANGTFVVKSDDMGIVFATVDGKSTINNVNVVATVKVATDVKNFGAIAGLISGAGTTVTDCGVHTDISLASDKKAENVANFVGLISGKGVKISDSCVSGKNDAGVYSFVAEITADDTAISNIYMTKGTQSPLNFEKYTFVKKAQFNEWTYGENGVVFFTGNGGEFTVDVPDISAMRNASADDYTVTFDSTKLTAKLTANGAKLGLNIGKVGGVVTVKASPVVITNKNNGLSITVYVSNGLEKDSNGNYIVSNEYDMAYIGENVAELKNASFVVTADIDMTAITDFTPIGSTAEAFSGKFNGNGHTISNLKLNSGAKCGLFGAVENAVIKNIVIEKAVITSNGSYVAALVGHAVGSDIEDITIKDSKITTTDIYSGVVAGSVNGSSVKNIKVNNSSVNSTANYVGAVAGIVDSSATVSNVTVDGFTANGAEFVAGVAGFIGDGVKLSVVNVAGSTVKGTSNVSGIAAGDKASSAIEKATVENCRISTVGAESAYVGAGIASTFAGTISSASVNNTEVTAGTVGGIVGKSASECSLKITSAQLNSVKLIASGANTVAAGILGVHSTDGSVSISGCAIDENTVISSAAISAGMVGSVLGGKSELSLTDTKSFATVDGCINSDAVSAAGVVGIIGISSVNNVRISSVNVLGKVSGAGSVAGAIGAVNDTQKFNSDKALISDSVIAVELSPLDNATAQNSGMIIGSVASDKSLNSENIDSAISGLVITTYYPNTTAFGSSTKLASSGYYDMDKPNGKAITPSASTLNTTGEKEITISNLPNVNGYKFDSATGWVSESADRIEVVSSTENSVTLKANHLADLGIVGYYVSASDNSVKIPVHFAMKSDVRTPLKGEGTKESPYLVSSAYDLETVATYDSNGKYFALSSDISFKDEDFEFGGAFYNVGNGLVTIGSAEKGFNGTFTGLYNGVVHSINDIKLSGNAFGGLFGATDSAVISDIIIKNADIKGLNYAGVLVGSAKNTTIKNITVIDASVETTELGGFTGGIVGYAENTAISNITLNGISAKTVENSTSATVEVVGGVAGVFSGSISGVKLDGAKLTSAYLAGGVVGTAKFVDDVTTITDVNVNATVSGKNSAGVVAEIANPLNVQIDNVMVSGSVNAEKLSAGIIGEIKDGYSLANAGKSLIKNTVVTATVNSAEISGVAVGNASIETFENKSNDKCKVFDNVCYSSGNNSIAVFGNKEINSYQIDEYKVNDLNNMKYIVGGTQTSSIPYSAKVDIGNGSLVVLDVDGSYKEFTAGGHKFALDNVSGKAKYENETLYLESDAVGTLIKFNYNDGLVLSIKVAGAEKKVGTKIDVKCNIVDATSGLKLTDKTVGVLLKSVLADETSSFSFYTKANGTAKTIEAVYVDGGFYVDMDIPTELDFTLTATTADGNEIKVSDCDNEGYLVKSGENSSVVLTITVKDADSSVWGLRSVWSNLDK